MNFFYLMPFENSVFFPQVNMIPYSMDFPLCLPTFATSEKIISEKISVPEKLNVTKEDLIRAGYHRNYTPWSEEEDKQLKKLVKVEKMDWKKVAEKMGNRNAKMCYSRYQRLSYHSKKRWEPEEEELIVSFVTQYGKNWNELARILKSKNKLDRTVKQIQQYYEFHLKPNIKKTDWTLEEDLLLIELI